MLKEKIKQDLNNSLKENNQIKVSTLRLLLAAVFNKEKEKKYKERLKEEVGLTDEEIIKVISSEAKKRKEAISEYEKGERKDLAKKEKAELEVLKNYLPQQFSDEQIDLADFFVCVFVGPNRNVSFVVPRSKFDELRQRTKEGNWLSFRPSGDFIKRDNKKIMVTEYKEGWHLLK